MRRFEHIRGMLKSFSEQLTNQMCETQQIWLVQHTETCTSTWGTQEKNSHSTGRWKFSGTFLWIVSTKNSVPRSDARTAKFCDFNQRAVKHFHHGLYGLVLTRVIFSKVWLFQNASYLVDPASTSVLVSTIKLCMSNYKHVLYCERADGSIYMS